ncbi:MAG: hypothetical protein HOV81_37115 [Kofleriaceae bacterium]|nr:hypothetical protein [Kofleriaceae bacterium]
MDVFLIRHADAIDETLDLRDPMRHLTAHGRAQATALGDRLRWLDCMPTNIWTSHLVRAVQTAELVATALAATVPIEVVPGLAPGQPTRTVLAALEALPADAVVLLVGHEPGMSAIGTLLLGKDLGALAKAEAARIAEGELRYRCAWDAEAPKR